MAVHGDTVDDFARVKVKNAAMGALNPHARYRKRVTADEVAASAVVAVRPAALLPATASAGQVRSLLTGSPAVSGVLLVDRGGVPVRSVRRSRFLLSMSGRYGHALYADRPAAKLGDPPRTVGIGATAWDVLDVVADGERDRTSDDVAVVDRQGRCVGVVRLADLLRALA